MEAKIEQRRSEDQPFRVIAVQNESDTRLGREPSKWLENDLSAVQGVPMSVKWKSSKTGR